MKTENHLPESPYFTLHAIGDGAYAAVVKDGQGMWGNAGFVDLGDATLVFDTTALPAAAADLRRIAEEVTGHPVRYAVNSHWHGDHIHGNEVFRDVPIYSTAKTRELIFEKATFRTDVAEAQADLQRSVDAMEIECQAHPADSIFAIDVRYEIDEKRKISAAFASMTFTAPNVTFEESLLLHGTKRTAVLLSYGGGHTVSDAFLYLPDAKIAYLGDLVTVETHPRLATGQPREWLTILERLRALDIETLFTGHGAVGSPDNIAQVAGYIQQLITQVEAAVARGESLETVLSMPIPEEYATWRVPHVYKWNLQKLFHMVTEERALTANV